MTITALMVCLFICSTAKASRRPPAHVDRAIRHAAKVYRVPYGEMVAVAWCESRFNPRAVGRGSHGLYQFLASTWARTPYASRNVYSAWWNALAAAWLWRADGGSWREWTCRP